MASLSLMHWLVITFVLAILNRADRTHLAARWL
jgi:hypothetical protein